MADICTSVENVCAGGGHGNLSINGVSVGRVDLHEEPTADEIAIARKVGLWRLRQKGVPLSQFLGRVVIGEEATNVKGYALVAPGVAIVKTNVGGSPQNVLPGASGQQMLVDFTGCTEFRASADINIASGTWAFQIVRADGEILYQSPNLNGAGENDPDTGWLPLPPAFDSEALMRVRVGSSPTASATVRRVLLAVK